MDLRCARRGSDRIIPYGRGADYGTAHPAAERSVIVDAKPRALLFTLLFKGTARVRLLARVRGDRGHAGFFVENPGALYGAYPYGACREAMGQ